jgi:phosphoglycerate dehydrogenase-like enzyme
MDSETVALRVLAHFKPSNRAIEQVAAESDWLDVRWVAEEDDEAFYRELPEAEVLWHVLRPLNGADLEKAPKLKLIHKFGTGVNTIDVDTAAKRGIAVANMPGANAPAVAESTIMLMLAALRKLPQLDRATRAGRGWPTDPALGDTVRDLGSCNIGLVGYGNVAKRVEQILRAMGNVTIVHTSSARDEFHINWVSTSELLKKCDIVSLHLPLNAKTEGMIDADAIAGMKPGAILINTARGGIIDEDALVDALRSGHLQAAGLDVFAQEPVDPSNPLLALENVVVTPHVSWYTGETMERYLDSALLNCRRLHEQRSPYFLVEDSSE